MDALNIVVVCGKHVGFKAWLARAASHPNLSVLGFVPAELMSKLMRLADVPVLGSLAPATMQELLESQCGPLMLFHLIPGAEDAHGEHIERNQIGLYEPNPEAMVTYLQEVVGLKSASARVALLLSSFRTRAAAIRTANVERAMKLPDFLDQITQPAHVPRKLHSQRIRSGLRKTGAEKPHAPAARADAWVAHVDPTLPLHR